jgi:hypothetical protein
VVRTVVVESAHLSLSLEIDLPTPLPALTDAATSAKPQKKPLNEGRMRGDRYRRRRHVDVMLGNDKRQTDTRSRQYLGAGGAVVLEEASGNGSGEKTEHATAVYGTTRRTRPCLPVAVPRALYGPS